VIARRFGAHVQTIAARTVLTTTSDMQNAMIDIRRPSLSNH